MRQERTSPSEIHRLTVQLWIVEGIKKHVNLSYMCEVFYFKKISGVIIIE